MTLGEGLDWFEVRKQENTVAVVIAGPPNYTSRVYLGEKTGCNDAQHMATRVVGGEYTWCTLMDHQV